MNAPPDPGVALLFFGALATLAAVVFWPGGGVVARLRRLSQMSGRVRLEDGVKHLFTSEAAQRPASVDSLAGAIGVSRDRGAGIVRDLERMGLARLQDGAIVLTREGRAHALRIVRTHRLWERYLADRTGYGAGDWHARAERLEHGPRADAVERLAASMGDPLYDPHGDPIPTAAGVLPPARGVPLSSLAPGGSARVVHIEDEPEGIYESLRSGGLDAGSRLRLERIDASGLHLTVEGRRVTIDPIAALNLTVEPVEGDDSEHGVERLDVLRPGDEAVVVRVGAQVQGAQRRRLLDLGVVPGTVIRAELASLSGDPVAYRIRGAVIALRRAQADDILVRRRHPGEAA